MNIMEDASSITFDMDAWYIITVCGVSAFTVDTQAILQRAIKVMMNGFLTRLYSTVVKTKLRNKFFLYRA